MRVERKGGVGIRGRLKHLLMLHMKFIEPVAETHSRTSLPGSRLSPCGPACLCVQSSPDTCLWSACACLKYNIGVSFACELVRSFPTLVGFQCSVKQRDPFTRLVVMLSSG